MPKGSSFIGTSLDNMVPGVLTRYPGKSTKESQPASEQVKYGHLVMMVNGMVKPLAGDVTAADVYGMIERPFPEQSAWDIDGPQTDKPVSVIITGYAAVQCNLNDTAVTSVKTGAPVYYVTKPVTTPVAYNVGDFISVEVTGSTVLVPNMIFFNPPDSLGRAEVRFDFTTRG